MLNSVSKGTTAKDDLNICEISCGRVLTQTTIANPRKQRTPVKGQLLKDRKRFNRLFGLTAGKSLGQMKPRKPEIITIKKRNSKMLPSETSDGEMDRNLKLFNEATTENKNLSADVSEPLLFEEGLYYRELDSGVNSYQHLTKEEEDALANLISANPESTLFEEQWYRNHEWSEPRPLKRSPRSHHTFIKSRTLPTVSESAFKTCIGEKNDLKKTEICKTWNKISWMNYLDYFCSSFFFIFGIMLGLVAISLIVWVFFNDFFTTFCVEKPKPTFFPKRNDDHVFGSVKTVVDRFLNRIF